MKTNNIDFTVDFRTEFGNATDKRKCAIADTAEQTFKNALGKMTKQIAKTWEVIEFPFNGEKIVVSRDWLIETDFDWEQSHEVHELD